MSSDLLKHAAEIIEAYVSNNEVQARELPGLLREVFGTLTDLSTKGTPPKINETISDPETEEDVVPESYTPTEKKKIEPFLPIDEAVTDEAVFCLICGKSCKALKGHLTRSHKIDFDEYRAMFDLDKSFPMVAPAYSDKRRSLAIAAGLGDKLRDSRRKGAGDTQG
ncbi:MAG: MucR family transcriptional regulator [Magnetococcales bacterium]|nr:MucR family transcriptional regulator [Magnetococcales bacterium]